MTERKSEDKKRRQTGVRRETIPHIDRNREDADWLRNNRRGAGRQRRQRRGK